MDRRLAAVEANTGIGAAQQMLVKHQPVSLDAVPRRLDCRRHRSSGRSGGGHPALWQVAPRDAAEEQNFLTSRLCADCADLMRRVLAVPAYDAQLAVLAGLHAA